MDSSLGSKERFAWELYQTWISEDKVVRLLLPYSSSSHIQQLRELRLAGNALCPTGKHQGYGALPTFSTNWLLQGAAGIMISNIY